MLEEQGLSKKLLYHLFMGQHPRMITGLFDRNAGLI